MAYKGEPPQAPKLAPYLGPQRDTLGVLQDWMRVVVATCELVHKEESGSSRWQQEVLDPLWNGVGPAPEPTPDEEHSLRDLQLNFLYGLYRNLADGKENAVRVFLRNPNDPELLAMLATALLPRHFGNLDGAMAASETYAVLLAGARKARQAPHPGMLVPTKEQAAWMDTQLAEVWPTLDTTDYDPAVALNINGYTLQTLIQDHLPVTGDVDRQLAAILVEAFEGYAAWVGYPTDLCCRIITALHDSRKNFPPEGSSPETVRSLRQRVRLGPYTPHPVGWDKKDRNKQVAKLFAEALMIAEAPASDPKAGERRRVVKMLETARQLRVVPEEYKPTEPVEIWARIRDAIPLQA